MLGACSLNGIELRLRWFREYFGVEPPSDVMDHITRQYDRTYILALTGSVLDKSRIYLRLFVLPLLQDIEEVGTVS